MDAKAALLKHQETVDAKSARKAQVERDEALVKLQTVNMKATAQAGALSGAESAAGGSHQSNKGDWWRLPPIQQGGLVGEG